MTGTMKLGASLIVLVLIAAAAVTLLPKNELNNATVQDAAKILPPVVYSAIYQEQAYIYAPAAMNGHMAKHGDWAEKITVCVNSNGAEYIMTNKNNGRRAMLCWLEVDMCYGVYIEEADGTPVTSFPKEKMGCDLPRVLQYLFNHGYE